MTIPLTMKAQLSLHEDRLARIEKKMGWQGGRMRELSRRFTQMGKQLNRLEKSLSFKSLSQSGLVILNIGVAIVTLILMWHGLGH